MELSASDLDDRTYVFGAFEFLPGRQLLLRDGAPVSIGARALDILTLLVRRAGELVSKEDLTKFVWPDTFVSEGNLKVNIAALRRVLSEGSPGVAHIATNPGRGYRFVMPVQVRQPAISSSPHPGHSTFFNNLPEPHQIIGRAHEISLLAGQLTTARCVTIVGVGGGGKTTVALAVAHQVKCRYFDGVCFVDLSTVGAPQYVAAAIATALGTQSRARDMLSGVIAALRDRQLLLLLDNCEHLSSAVASVTEQILDAAARVSVIATSREPLRTAQEQVYRLSTLGVPDDQKGLSASRALEFPAVELFVTRAAQRGDYVFTDADAPIVAAICRRLDGIALAVELAAGKIVGCDPTRLLDMLEQQFRVLNCGPRNAPMRQQTLFATLDWSYRLLSDREATILRLLSVFAGYFSQDDAIAMSEWANLAPSDTIDGLGQLVAKSLVAVEYRDNAVRYRLLESTRAYAAERLSAEAEDSRALHRYALIILARFERAENEWFWRASKDWTSEHAGRIDDLRKAITWAFDPMGNRELGVKLTTAAIPLWDELSQVEEARARVDYALAALQEMDGYASVLKMKLATAHAWSMTHSQHLVPGTETAWLDCVQFASEAQSTEYQLRGLWGFAVYLMYTGRHHRAIAQLEQFQTIAARQTEESATPDGERLLANGEIYVGRLDTAVRRLEALAARYDRFEQRSRLSRFQVERYVAIRGTLSLAFWLTGSPGRAAQAAQEAVEGARAIGHITSHSTALALWILPVTFWSGNYDRAAAFQATLDENNQIENIEIWGPVSRFFHGAIQFARGEELGIVEMREALTVLVEGNFVGRTPMYRSMLSEALLSSGKVEEADATLNEARTAAEAQGERWCLPEIMRVRGLIDLHQNNPAAAELSLTDALSEARQIGAIALELRAALTLCDKWAAEERSEEARSLLNSIVERFDDDPEYADLIKARARLDRLNRTRSGARAGSTAD
ncbi:winged helix-turn-helix domain-containing protein [Paraburkholderia sp. BCC1884]|uniref:winged helix-turn-helix domain-containing protein n=1 Tax=Paraburkholderia sp. BCC1884 TaxID=2562668 RepID=UPI00118235F0|nr:winged helix-turn-helix domain-containing protein [Paraburkholderia sp. BCC1884]